MPQVPRFPLRVLLASTTLALLAAAATVVVLSDDDTRAPDPSGVVELTPEGAPRSLDSVTFREFDGTEVALSSLRGAPVLINFFASYCVPCIKEMPAFETVHQEVGDQVTFLGLAVSDRRDAALALVERTGVTYRTAQDADGAVLSTLRGTVLPTSVLLDADGSVVASHAGELDADELRSLLADELGIEP